MSDPHFYRDLQPFHSFVDEVFDPRFYVELPSDWLLVVADITGSTRAVNSGKYAEVNYLGAACIVAVNNAIDGLAVPSVFGGDGATLAIPPEAVPAATQALLATRRWGSREFGLDLRVGLVPMTEIVRRGAGIAVAKLELSPGNYMAMFRGDGFDLADALVKADDGEDGFLATESASTPARPDLESLSCRWAPIPPDRDHMLCLIIGARSSELEQADATYRDVLEGIDGIVTLREADASPVKLSGLRFRLRLASIEKEAKTNDGPRALAWLRAIGMNVFAWLVFKAGRRIGNFDPEAYRHEITTNSDFRKVNGMLRLILDCSAAQSDAIEKLLGAHRAAGRIVYGAHRAENAMMTCVAPNIENHEHVHFIDGTEGGFWSAAKGLKDQLRADAEG